MHQGSQTLESIAHDEGRFLAVQGQSGTEFIDTWHVRDYLGSVRAVYDITPDPEDVTSAGSQILEQNDYYAFGGRIDDPYQPYDQTNRYRYNGKEQLRFEGINQDPGLTDYGARYYAPTFGRWTTPDPLADKYYSVSPYAFCNNNPVNFIDPDGMDILDKFVGYSLGLFTNVVPGTGRVRDLYNPTDSRDYNSALRDVDNAAAVVGTGMTKVGGAGMIAGGAAAAAGVGMTVASGGTAAVVGAPVAALGAEVAIAGAKTTAAGMILMANSAQNKSGGYERGNTSSGKSSEITFIQGTPGKERKVTVPIPKGYRKLKIRTSKDMPIYYNGKTYISPDRYGHNGGIWKQAKTPEELNSRNTRMGTYDEYLKRIGD